MTRVAGLLLLLLAVACAHAQVIVGGVRTWPAPDHTRVVIDIDGPVEHSVFVLHAPERVVVDLRRARLGGSVDRGADDGGLLKRVRGAGRGSGDVRIVLETASAVRPRSFLLKPNAKYGHRLVVDLLPQSAGPASRAARGGEVRLRDVVVAIDAGHGGEDPGAIGSGGTREKDVVLAVARRLEALLRSERGMRPLLVREGDYYLGLRRRMEVAREGRADLFVSIHADSFNDSRVRGSSVFVLSRRGASSEAARWLAEQENAADLVGGVSLDDKDELLASVLLDLSQTATLSASTEVGSRVLERLQGSGAAAQAPGQARRLHVLKVPGHPVDPGRDRVHHPARARAAAERRGTGSRWPGDSRGVRVGRFRRNAPRNFDARQPALHGRARGYPVGDRLAPTGYAIADLREAPTAKRDTALRRRDPDDSLTGRAARSRRRGEQLRALSTEPRRSSSQSARPPPAPEHGRAHAGEQQRPDALSVGAVSEHPRVASHQDARGPPRADGRSAWIIAGVGATTL
ncbi:MAG: N-acetylmuramoyl-L-alanine amidase [Ectothiorhodospiraceae bacterium]|nr:N-acetylmuramoyl-L-alanine amidase [Ectothiorhodospiraceae bacterium]